MRYLKWMLPLLVIIGAVFVSRIVKHSRPETPVVARDVKPPTVRVMTAYKKQYQPHIQTQGTVRPKRAIELVPEVAGKIIWVSPSFSNGGSFNKGDVLVRIDPSNYQFAIERAQANVADAQAKLALEAAEGEIARQDWEDISNGRQATDLALRKPQLAGAKAKLASTNADLRKAQLDLARTNIKAPFQGRVDVKRSDIGKYVSLGNNLADVYSTDVAEIYLPLTDKQIGEINLQPIYERGKSEQEPLLVKLTADVGGKSRTWTGHITRTAGSVDQNNRVLNVIVEVENPYDVKENGAPLLNGLFVHAEIPGAVIDDVVEIPRAAIRNQSQIVIVDQDNKLWSRAIDIVDTTRQAALVRGVNAGERIVISPLDILIEGSEVVVSDKGA
jgi:RND family efflux transporter MFP subunit